MGRIAPGRHSRQEQDLLLDVRCQLQEVHDLSHPRPGDVTEAGQIGLVGDGSRSDQVVEPDIQGHQPADAGDDGDRPLLGLVLYTLANDLPPLASASEMNLPLERQVALVSAFTYT